MPNDLIGALLWAVRMAIISGGAALTARGFGDATVWEAVAGGAVALAGAVWSWRARKQQLATVPPGA
jgi:hypothetical protein